jgi:CRP-like cAMP-binding protein
MQRQPFDYPFAIETSTNHLVLPDLRMIELPRLQSFLIRDALPLSSSWLWRIEQGFVRTLTSNAAGEVITLGIWGEGEVVGQSLSQIEPYQVECLTMVQARALPYSNAWLYDSMLSQIQQMEALLSIMHIKQLSCRLLKLLEWLACRFGDRVDRGWMIDLRLTHQVIAEMLGTTRVTITRILKELEQEKKLQRLQKHRILLEASPQNLLGQI